MQCFFRASNIVAFFSSQDVHLRMVEMLALRQFCSTPPWSPSSNHHNQHRPPHDQSDFDYVNPHPHHHRMLKVVVMFALRRSRPAHHIDRWHRAPKTMQNKQSLCDTAKKSSFGRCLNTCWLSLTFEKKKPLLDSVCTALFSQVEVSQRSRLQIFKH